MPIPIIEAEHLCKDFIVYKKTTGFYETLKSLFHRENSIKTAVDDLTFSVNKGELVGYIGPNGAGKSTTIKMLTGILIPSKGNIMVRGIVPHKNRRDNAMHIGVVFGQRSQLYWDLPMSDTFQLYKKMYKIDDTLFKHNVEFYTKQLDMAEFIDRPVRQLSLGQKMRAELAVALLHNPEVVFLDEPTIGLDVLAKRSIRSFIKAVNQERQVTVILTTHDMNDIEEICNRLILIDKGKLLYDGEIGLFKEKYSEDSVIEFSTTDHLQPEELGLDGVVVRELGGLKKSLSYHPSHYTSAQILQQLMTQVTIQEFSLKEASLDDLLTKIYTTAT